MTERLNVAVSKTVVRANVPRVRIPLSPPPLIIQTPVKYPAHPWSTEIKNNWFSFLTPDRHSECINTARPPVAYLPLTKNGPSGEVLLTKDGRSNLGTPRVTTRPTATFSIDAMPSGYLRIMKTSHISNRTEF